MENKRGPAPCMDSTVDLRHQSRSRFSDLIVQRDFLKIVRIVARIRSNIEIRINNVMT
jgi:hypothetical protein